MFFAANSKPADPAQGLERAVKTAGAKPLLTYYDLASGERTELSVRTFANWVDKTANLLVSLDVASNPRIANCLLVEHPMHWVSMIWTMAIWQLGGTVVAKPRSELGEVADLELAVIGPDNPHPVPAIETVACSLHPFGLGFAEPLVGVNDYGEVLSQPDAHWRAEAVETACLIADQEYDWAGFNQIEPSSSRRLFTGSGPIAQLLTQALVAPIYGGGHSVLVVGQDQQQIEKIASQEKAELVSPR